MTKKAILLVEDDAQVEQSIKSALGSFAFEVVKGAADAADAIRKKKPALIIIDYDLKQQDGLQVYRQIHLLAPYVRVIMLSFANNIPLAVMATKMGVADFLKKPALPKDLLAAVERNLVHTEEAVLPADVVWLQGSGPALKKMYEAIHEALPAQANMVLIGERGIDKKDVAAYIHRRGLKQKRQFRVIDLSSFKRENLEGSFWATVQEAVGEGGPAAAENEEDRCGTLYLENIESLEQSFRLSIFEFFKEKKPKIDREVLVVIGLYAHGSLPAVLGKNFVQVEIPPLRARREDLSQLISRLLAVYSARHNKNVNAISGDLLYLFGLSDFPGNYHELSALLEIGVLNSTSGVLELKALPVDMKSLIAAGINDAHLKGRLSLEEARRWLEKLTYKTLLAKNGQDMGAAARFLDIPRTTLGERVAELGGDLLN